MKAKSDGEYFAEVVFDRPMRQSYHYRIPKNLQDDLTAGKRVQVSFGRQNRVIGYCVGLTQRVSFPTSKLKNIQEVLDAEPLLSKVMLQLTKQVSDHYCCAWGEVIQAAIPRGVRSSTQSRTIKIVQLAKPQDEIKKWIEEHQNGRKEKRARVLRVLLEEVQGDVTPFELASMCGTSKGVVDALRKEGFLKNIEKLMDEDPFDSLQSEKNTPLVLNEEQQAAINTIQAKVRAQEFSVILVQGVTGSGKTEVYLQSIEEVVCLGKQAIVLVPEISLTPQTVQRFRARFEHLAVLHSRQTEAQRRNQWQAIKKNKVQVIIGARSAIFAPTYDLGLIVIDEEHENSFKQDNSPRYNARDVAVMRGKLENAVVLLGSATPSLESYNNSKKGKYDRVVLRYRVANRPLPPVEIVDMNLELAGAKYWSFLSQRMVKLIEHSLSRKEQVLLFLNRRGFSTKVRCFRCGYCLQCDHCTSALTYYQRRHLAICLHCRKEIKPPELCPDCRVGKLRYLGIGTEKVEQEVLKKFPSHRIARMDSDTMRGHGALEKTFSDFREGRIDILIGTQMISKGLDFPNVTLVGVISADTSFQSADFRAYERTFQMVAQVAGRAGRGDKPGRVIVQSFSPQHHSIQLAAQHDFEAFAVRELEDRTVTDYPPFCRVMRILCSGSQESDVEATCDTIMKRLKSVAPSSIRFLGPAPCVISLVRDRYRWHMMILAPEVGMIRFFAQSLERLIQSTRKVTIALDVDPVNVF